jgi:phosphoribosyl 1,2-cyclic phosphodiesterase
MIASIGDPRQNKNYRNNPSLLISHRNQDDGNLCNGDDGDNVDDNDDAGDENHHERNGLKNVIIDVGKTFREGALRWMPRHGIYHIDGIVLTHEHADAIFGLDDLRGFQLAPPPCTKTKSSPGGVTSTREQDNSSMSIPVFLSAKCLKTVKKAFGYLVPKEPTGHAPKDNETKVVRHVASLNFQTVEWFQPFYVAGLKMIPLPVMHGEDFICNGYAFSVKGDKGVTVNVVYLSDISRMIPETEKFILEELPPTDILVVDTLMFRKKHAVHFSLDQALALVKRLKASKTYLVGMNCDDFPEHDVANRLVQERDATVEFAHDGLVIEI